MKHKLLLGALVLAVLSTSCKKITEVTEVTEVTQVVDDGVEVWSWVQPVDPPHYLDISESTSSDIFNPEDHLIAQLEIGALNEGDIVVVDTQIRVRPANGAQDCAEPINIRSGPSLSIFPNDRPNESPIDFEWDAGYIEQLSPGESHTIHSRQSVSVMDTTVQDAFVGLWVLPYRPGCDFEEGIRLQVSNMIVKIYRN